MTFHDHRMPLPAAARPAARKQLGPVTLAIRAMRSAYALAPKAPTRRTGPVTEAIRTMRAAVPDFDANPDLIALRRALANRIEADIAALDMLGGDPDLEDGCDLEQENEHGGDVQDEPHDPEEDCDIHEMATAVEGFDGTNYSRSRLNRRVNIVPSGLVIVGPDGANYSVSRVTR